MILADDDGGPAMWYHVVDSGDWPAPASDPDRAASEPDTPVSEPDCIAAAAAATGDAPVRGVPAPERLPTAERDRLVYQGFYSQYIRDVTGEV